MRVSREHLEHAAFEAVPKALRIAVLAEERAVEAVCARARTSTHAHGFLNGLTRAHICTGTVLTCRWLAPAAQRVVAADLAIPPLRGKKRRVGTIIGSEVQVVGSKGADRLTWPRSYSRWPHFVVLK